MVIIKIINGPEDKKVDDAQGFKSEIYWLNNMSRKGNERGFDSMEDSPDTIWGLED